MHELHELTKEITRILTHELYGLGNVIPWVLKGNLVIVKLYELIIKEHSLH